MRVRVLLTTVLAALALATSTACGAPTSSPPTTSSNPSAAPAVSPEHNTADVAFTQGMIPHHRQAVDMSALAPTRAASPEVKDLAARISAAQGPEIEQMTGMLAAWGAPAPPAGAMSGMGSMPMNGMLSEQQMGQLTAASGTGFDRMFLEQMTAHHRGAVQMAQTELAQGQNPQAKALAETIIAAQQAEITEMQALLNRA